MLQLRATKFITPTRQIIRITPNPMGPRGFNLFQTGNPNVSTVKTIRPLNSPEIPQWPNMSRRSILPVDPSSKAAHSQNPRTPPPGEMYLAAAAVETTSLEWPDVWTTWTTKFSDVTSHKLPLLMTLQIDVLRLITRGSHPIDNSSVWPTEPDASVSAIQHIIHVTLKPNATLSTTVVYYGHRGTGVCLFVLVSSFLYFFLATCARLSWILGFRVHVKLHYRIV